MEPHRILAILVQLAEEIGLPVRRAPSAGGTGEHPGGAIVRLKGQEMIFLDPSAAAADQISVVAAALAGREDIENRFLPPEVREEIDRAASGAADEG